MIIKKYHLYWKYHLYGCSEQKQPPDMFYKKMFLRIFHNLQENTCVGVSS